MVRFRRSSVVQLIRDEKSLNATELFLTLFLVQAGTDRNRAIRVHSALALFDVLDEAFLIHHKGSAIGELLFFVEDAVILGDFATHVAQEGIAEAELLRELAICGGAIDADAEYLRIVGVDLAAGDTILVRLEFGGSTRGECQDVKCQHNIFLAVKFAEAYFFPCRIGKREVRSFVAHFKIGVRDLRLLRWNRHGRAQQ